MGTVSLAMTVDLAVGVVKTLQANNAANQRELDRLLRLVEEGARREREAQRLLDDAVNEIRVAAVVKLDELTARLRAAHAVEGPNGVLARLETHTSAVKAFMDANSTPPYFNADQARRGYARDAQQALEVLNGFAVTQARLPAPVL